MNENRRYSAPDSYRLEEEERPNQIDTGHEFASNINEMSSFDQLKRHLASMDSRDRLHYLTEQVERTFSGKKLRMFSKQLQRQGSIEEENFELL